MAGDVSTPVQGVLFSLSAGILWGIVPLFIHYIDADGPYEIVAQRALWSAVLLFLICGVAGELPAIRRLLLTPRLVLNFFVTTVFLTLNWGVYVYAVQSGQVVAAALGYFMYPLCTVLLGMVLLGERLDRWAWLAIGLVFLGVVAKAMIVMTVPWVSLMLASSFSFYAVLRKRMNQDPAQGLFIETLILLPLVLGFFLWMTITDKSLFFGGGLANFGLAVTAGIITVVPLILFHKGNRALSMTMASLIFYSNPTTQLLIGVLLFREFFEPRDLIAFGFIWTGIAVYFSTRKRIMRLSSPNT